MHMTTCVKVDEDERLHWQKLARPDENSASGHLLMHLSPRAAELRVKDDDWVAAGLQARVLWRVSGPAMLADRVHTSMRRLGNMSRHLAAKGCVCLRSADRPQPKRNHNLVSNLSTSRALRHESRAVHLRTMHDPLCGPSHTHAAMEIAASGLLQFWPFAPLK